MASMPETPRPARLVIRVADMILGPGPGAAEDQCGRCGEPAWMTPAQEIPSGMAGAELVCTRCAINHEAFRDDPALIAKMRRSHYWASRLRHTGGQWN
jgi:hypothetical protein